ncbi:hypothetical protein GGH95_006625 [Coemansia sp. RSA 1836]|nr:hypothetical protein GGH95_006625 [Coemansia sp. RSA 1836]
MTGAGSWPWSTPGGRAAATSTESWWCVDCEAACTSEMACGVSIRKPGDEGVATPSRSLQTCSGSTIRTCAVGSLPSLRPTPASIETK